MSKDTGGQAFPRSSQCENESTIDAQGMTLRDYFAGQAMIKVLDGFDYMAAEVQAETRAEYCYQIADAMIAERNKK